MNTRLASYSERTIMKRLETKRISGKAIQEAVKTGLEIDLEITDFSNQDCGRYVSPSELKTLGYDHVFVRFNHDRPVCKISLI